MKVYNGHGVYMYHPGTGVMLVVGESDGSANFTSTPTTLEVKGYDGLAPEYDGNKFVAVMEDTTIMQTDADGNYNYFLARVSGQAKMFYKVYSSGLKFNAGIAYLKLTSTEKDGVENAANNSAKSITVVFGDGDTDGINAVNVNVGEDVNAPLYNLAGQRVTSSYKGVVVRNGKKILNK